MDLNPPSPVHDFGLINRMDKMDVKLTNLIQCIHFLGKHSDRNNEDDGGDHDDNSQSSLNVFTRVHTKKLGVCQPLF